MSVDDSRRTPLCSRPAYRRDQPLLLLLLVLLVLLVELVLVLLVLQQSPAICSSTSA
jgi:hypothetical protein